MRPGQRDKVITIQSKTMSTDSYGGQVETWADFAKVWANVWPLKGRELVAAQAAQSETTVRFNIRWIAGLTEAMRISYNSKLYDITGIIDVGEKHVEFEIMAKTGLSEG
jgi:SPP1 family predicted phage head-tail adaptor